MARGVRSPNARLEGVLAGLCSVAMFVLYGAVALIAMTRRISDALRRDDAGCACCDGRSLFRRNGGEESVSWIDNDANVPLKTYLGISHSRATDVAYSVSPFTGRSDLIDMVSRGIHAA